MRRRLYRIPAQGKLAGICAGVGDSFSLDPTIIRLAAVFLCVLTSFVPLIAVYLVGWFIIPDKADFDNTDSGTDAVGG